MKRSANQNRKNSGRRRKRTNRGTRFLFMIPLAILMIFLSGKAVLTTEAGTADSTRYKYYNSIEIEEDTTLWEVAELYMTEEYDSIEDYIDEVMEINHLKSDLIYTGAYICVPYYSSEVK